jgi:hypothetical protein
VIRVAGGPDAAVVTTFVANRPLEFSPPRPPRSRPADEVADPPRLPPFPGGTEGGRQTQ